MNAKTDFPTIRPIAKDPKCLNFTRVPDGMIDPVYDEVAGEGFAGRDAANFTRCHESCPSKSCRRVGACLANGAIAGEGACQSEGWNVEVQYLAMLLAHHGVNIRERHRAWHLARLHGADLPVCDPRLTDEELEAMKTGEDVPYRPKFLE